MRGWSVGLVAVALALSCGKKDGAASPATVSASASAGPAASSAAVAAPGPHGGVPCGELGCLAFDKPQDALLTVLDEQPEVLSVGEAHAQKGAKVASSARRFTTTLLPLLHGRASDLLVELMMPPKGCKAKTQAVRQKQKVVTSKQAPQDQNEYVQMGNAAHALGIVPDLLRPTCADMDAVNDAGADAIVASLSLIARLTATQSEAMVARDRAAASGAGKVVVTYGGALHNDLAPPPERAAWAFGPKLAEYTHGRYAELDTYVPEFIEPTDSWKKMEWYAHYDGAKLGGKAVLFRPRPHEYVLIYPRSS